MELSFKLSPSTNIVYDLNTLDLTLNDNNQEYEIEFNPFPFYVNYSKYISLKTKFRPISQKVDTLVIVLPKCNGYCWYCSNKNIINNKPSIKLIDNFIKIIEKFKNKKYNVVITGGEPTENLNLLYTILEMFNIKSLQIYTSLVGLYSDPNTLQEFIKNLKNLGEIKISLFVTIDGLNSKYHPSYNKDLETLIDYIKILKSNLKNINVVFRQNISSPNFIKVYNYLISNVEFEFGYSVLGLLESYENNFSNKEIQVLNKYAKENYRHIKKHGLPIRTDITYYNTNFSSNIIPLLRGRVLEVNNSYHIMITDDKIRVIDPVKNYLCNFCNLYPNCGSEDNCKKIYKRCLKCPILYTCCFSSSLIPYYKKSTCNISIRSEILNYYLILKSKLLKCEEIFM